LINDISFKLLQKNIPGIELIINYTHKNIQYITLQDTFDDNFMSIKILLYSHIKKPNFSKKFGTSEWFKKIEYNDVKSHYYIFITYITNNTLNLNYIDFDHTNIITNFILNKDEDVETNFIDLKNILDSTNPENQKDKN
jgi:hypothetical protein